MQLSQHQAFIAQQVAEAAHIGQMYGERSYVHHLIEVSEMVSRMGGGDTERAVAWLHDTIEDTSITAGWLTKRFSEDVVGAVVAMSKVDGESYEDYIVKVRANPIAKLVKIADTLCNLTNSVIESNLYRIDKYAKQLVLLNQLEDV